MKKFLTSIVLSTVLIYAACVSVFAAETVLSSQNLYVNGEKAVCEVYNIDGSNYFKLRDMAALLNGTSASFSVTWDEAQQLVSVTTGAPYEAVGGELVIGADKSATSVVSTQKILINGTAADNLSAYNIGGNNFFKLRDLGTALGFNVDYDEQTKSMIVTTSETNTGDSSQSDVTNVHIDIANKGGSTGGGSSSGGGGSNGSQLENTDTYTYNLKESEEAIVVTNKVFAGDVIVKGEANQIAFTNCTFNGNIINESETGAMVILDDNCVFGKNSKCIFRNSLKEGNIIDTEFPKFAISDLKQNFICDNCIGLVISFSSDVTMNGKSYSGKNSEFYLDSTQEMTLEDYNGQEYVYFVVAQYWENGEKKVTTIACYDEEV